MKCAAAAAFIFSLLFIHPIPLAFSLLSLSCVSLAARKMSCCQPLQDFSCIKLPHYYPKSGVHAGQGDASERQTHEKSRSIIYALCLRACSQMDFSFCVTKHHQQQSLASLFISRKFDVQYLFISLLIYTE
jgi:hypothetical protein